MTNNATHDAETEVQSYVAGINQWKFILGKEFQASEMIIVEDNFSASIFSLLTFSVFFPLKSDHAIPIFFCLVMGAWSDKHGRKPILCSAEVYHSYYILHVQ